MYSGNKVLTPEALERLLLEETMQDWKALWELVGAFRGEFVFEGSDAEIDAVIRSSLTSMFEKGLVEFSRNKRTSKEFLPIASNEVKIVLADSANWYVQREKDHMHVYCGTTEKGTHAVKEIWKNTRPPS